MLAYPTQIKSLAINGRRAITAHEASQFSGWSQNYISILCRSGELAAMRLRSGWLVDELALHQLVQEHDRAKSELREHLREDRRVDYAFGKTMVVHSFFPQKIAALGVASVMLFPFAAFATMIPLNNLPTHDVGKLLYRIKKIHERGIRTDGSLSVKTTPSPRKT